LVFSRIIPDYDVGDYPQNFEMLLLIGSDAWMEQKNNAIEPVVEYAVKNHIPVVAICNASNFMAESVTLLLKKITTPRQPHIQYLLYNNFFILNPI
jgi:putative intracellular protease/amidase